MPLISIIVPVYKVKEDYLRACIDSLIKQTFQDIEIILVDDGTPDHGGIICEEYAMQDKRIKVIHQKNQGVSVARNTGMQAATGQWITFVDADDWIELNSCEILKNIISKETADFIIFALTVNYNNKEIPNPFWDSNYSYLDKAARDELQVQLLYKTFSKFCPPHNMVGVAVCKLYKATFIKENNMKFIPKLSVSEDGVFNFWTLEKAEKVIYVNEFLYHYRKHTSSATYGYRKDANIDYGNGQTELLNCLKVTNKSETFYKALYYRIILNIFVICNQSYCHKDNNMSTKAKIKSIKYLCDLQPYKTAINKISVTEYFKNSGYFQKIGFLLLKNKSYILFYYFTIIKNVYIKFANYK